MKNKFLFVLAIAVIFLLTIPTWGKQIPSHTLSYACSAANIDGLPKDGKCLNLSHQSQSTISAPIFSVAQETLVNEYHKILAQVNISISNQQCEQQSGLILYGYYDRIDNTMVICKDVMKQAQEYIETLVHESWHAVQDCLDGLDNSNITALLTKDSDLLTTILNGLTPSEVKNILDNYEKVDQAYEVEAFFLQKYPRLVLKGLNTCVNL